MVIIVQYCIGDVNVVVKYHLETEQLINITAEMPLPRKMGSLILHSNGDNVRNCTD